MAITGTGHNGITTYSLSEGVLTMVGPTGTYEVRVDDQTNDNGTIIGFNPLIGCAKIRYSFFGQTEIKDVPLGEINVRSDAQVSDSTAPVHTA